MPLNHLARRVLFWRWRVSAGRWRWAVWRGHGPDAVAAVQTWLSAAPTGTSHLTRRARATLAHLWACSGGWQEALELLQALHAEQPSHAPTAFNLGYTLQQLQQWPQAEAAFRQALCLSPKMDLAWFGLGDVLYRQGRWAEAAQAWHQQCELQPFCPDGWECLVRLYAQTGQASRALACLEQLKSFAPRHAMALEPLLANARPTALCTAEPGPSLRGAHT